MTQKHNHMGEQSKTIFTDYIAALYADIQAMPMRVPKKTAQKFDFDPCTPLDVQFGMETESLIYKGDELLTQSFYTTHPIGQDHKPEAKTFARKIKEAVHQHLFPSTERDLDDNTIELRLSPQTPINAISPYNKVKHAFEEQAHAQSYTPHYGITNHIHTSISQNDACIFENSIVQSPLTFSAISSFLKIQQEAPAFFIEPSRLEVEDDDHFYVIDGMESTVESMTSPFDRSHNLNSVLIKSPHKDINTVEGRVGINKPEQNIALYLSSLKWGLSTYPDYNLKIRSDKPEHIKKQFAKHDVFPNFDGIPFPKGKEAFFDVLEKTVSSKAIHDILPTPIFNALVIDAAERYIDFINSSDGHALYSKDERHDLSERTAQLTNIEPL